MGHPFFLLPCGKPCYINDVNDHSFGAKLNGFQVLLLTAYHILYHIRAYPPKFPDCAKHIDFIKSFSLIKQKHTGSKDMAVVNVLAEIIHIIYRSSYVPNRSMYISGN